MQDLEGILVLSLEQAVAAPLCTARLADAGARVIKVERDGGDFARHYDRVVLDQSAYFVWLNRGKESLVADIKNPDDQTLLHAIAAKADVFIQNLAPGAAARAVLGSASLRASNPRLITVDISGYGDSSYEDMKAYDLLVQAESGAVALTGDPERMSKVGFSVADICAGMYALSAILAALHRRAVTCEGAAISLSMLECLAEWTAPQTYASVADGAPPTRSARRHALIAPYGLFELDDGSVIMLAVQANPEWVALATEVMGRPELATDPRFATNAARVVNVDELEEAISACFAAGPATQVLSKLRAARIAFGRVNGPLEVAAHEQLHARDRFGTVELPEGEATMLRPPFNISAAGEPRWRVPALDEHEPELVDELIERARRRAHGGSATSETAQ